jgi:hypothetical protein
VAYYTVKADFPHLFERLIDSPAIKRIDDEMAGKSENRIHKQDWKPRCELELEIGAQNVIYVLLDSSSKRVYVGQAADLVGRLLQPQGARPWLESRGPHAPRGYSGRRTDNRIRLR